MSSFTTFAWPVVCRVAVNTQTGTSYTMTAGNSYAITSSTNDDQCVFTLPACSQLPLGTVFIFVNSSGPTDLKIVCNAENTMRLSAGTSSSAGGSLTSVNSNISITLASMHGAYWAQIAGSPEAQWTIT